MEHDSLKRPAIPPPEEITELLIAWRDGDSQALDHLTPIVYDELRRLARSYLNNERNPALQTTELVHEAYLRLLGSEVDWQGRGHFFVIAARLMRRVLVDLARKRRAMKRDGEMVPLRESDLPSEPAVDIEALDSALTELASFDPRKARVVELHFFAGLTIPEVARVLEISTATVERDLRAARAWLGQAVRGGLPAPPPLQGTR